MADFEDKVFYLWHFGRRRVRRLFLKRYIGELRFCICDESDMSEYEYIDIVGEDLTESYYFGQKCQKVHIPAGTWKWDIWKGMLQEVKFTKGKAFSDSTVPFVFFIGGKDLI